MAIIVGIICIILGACIGYFIRCLFGTSGDHND